MAIHTVAFLSAPGSAEFANLAPVSDGVFDVVGTGFLPREDVQLLAAVAGGVDLTAAQITEASFEYSPANIYPVNSLGPWPSPTGGLCHGDRPIRLGGREAFGAAVRAPVQKAVVLVWVRDGMEAAPQGESFLLGFSAGVIPGGPSWTATQLKWDVPFLPAGCYHILGMEVHTVDPANTNMVAARVNLAGQIYRPGTLLTASGRTVLPPFLMDGSMGSWGWFDHVNVPQLEVLSLTPGGPKVDFEGHLKVVKASTAPVGNAGRVNWG